MTFPSPADPGPAYLSDHGDRQVPPGAVDLAVNVLPGPPDWLRERLAAADLTGYPDPDSGLRAAGQRHHLPPDHCLLLNGAAEAFWLVALGLRPRLAACVHPSFTAPEAALRAAGVPVVRVVRRAAAGFALDPATVPPEADLVVLGRPDNPTGTLADPELVASLARPGRVVVVDEAFADFLPDASSLATGSATGSATGGATGGLPGVLCVRSLTKLWGLAGLRVGYLLGEPALLDRLRRARQPWPVSSPAVLAVSLLCPAEDERRARAEAVAAARAELRAALATLPVVTWPSPANFLLLRGPVAGLRDRLLDRHGLALRRCGSFPGLDDTYLRTAVPLDPVVRGRLVAALAAELRGTSVPTGSEPAWR